MLGIEIMPHTLPSVYKLLLSMFRKLIEAFVQLVSSVVNHIDHMLPFWRVTVRFFLPRKGKYFYSSKFHCILVLEDREKFLNYPSNLVSSSCAEIVAKSGMIIILVFLSYVIYTWFRNFSSYQSYVPPLNFDKKSCPKKVVMCT